MSAHIFYWSVMRQHDKNSPLNESELAEQMIKIVFRGAPHQSMNEINGV